MYDTIIISTLLHGTIYCVIWYYILFCYSIVYDHNKIWYFTILYNIVSIYDITLYMILYRTIRYCIIYITKRHNIVSCNMIKYCTTVYIILYHSIVHYMKWYHIIWYSIIDDKSYNILQYHKIVRYNIIQYKKKYRIKWY